MENNIVKLSEKEEIFSGIQRDNGKWSLIVGKFIVSERQFDDIKSMKEYIKKKPWELIINTVGAAIEIRKQLENK